MPIVFTQILSFGPSFSKVLFGGFKQWTVKAQLLLNAWIAMHTHFKEPIDSVWITYFEQIYSAEFWFFYWFYLRFIHKFTEVQDIRSIIEYL